MPMGKKMKGAKAPAEHYEHKYENTLVGGGKYSSDNSMGNPKELSGSVNKLAKQLKNHRMSYG